MGGVVPFAASMASVARISFNACKAPGNNAIKQQVRHSGGIQALSIRMKSVANIKKITKATQMVAASKLRGAEVRLKSARPLTAALKDLFGSLEKSEENPDGVEFKAESAVVVPITSDKGLCGSVNTNAVKMVRFQVLPPLEEAGVSISIVSVGEKGRSLLSRFAKDKLAVSVTQTFGQIPPNFAVAASIADYVLEQNADQATVCYSEFKSAVTQIPSSTVVPSYGMIATAAVDPFLAFETEDERSEILESFAEFNLAVTIYGAMLENNTSEVASKMAAMDNATRNAGDMYDALELKYNKARQSAITTELIEIISGAESLEG